MGNCFETCTHHGQEDGIENDQAERKNQEEQDGFEKSGFESSSFRVKILVTRQELDWLVYHCKEKGGRSVEDLLEEIQRGRGVDGDIFCKSVNSGWRPALESIMETPEVQALEMIR